MSSISWKGEPPNPHVSGYHWLRRNSNQMLYVALWDHTDQHWSVYTNNHLSTLQVAEEFSYVEEINLDAVFGNSSSNLDSQ